MSMCALVMLIAFFINICTLFGFHCYFLRHNLTTWEHLKWYTITYMEEFDSDLGSPFNEGVIKNMKLLLRPPRDGFWEWKATKDCLKKPR